MTFQPDEAAPGIDIVSRIRRTAESLPPGYPWITLSQAARADETLDPAAVIAGAGAWARHFARLGAAPGDRVIVCLPHSRALYLAFVGALVAGCVPSIYAPPSPKQHRDLEERTFSALLAASGARIAVLEPDAYRVGPDVSIARPDEVDAAAPGPVGLAWPDRAPGALGAFVQYSSGTTGLKKGVAIDGRMLSWQVDRYAESIALTPSDRIVSWLPLYHDMGLITALFMPLLCGVRLVALSALEWVREPALLLAAIERYRGTLCWQPNFGYAFLARYAQPEQRFDLASMRLFVNCSEPVLAGSHAAFLNRFAGCGVRPETLGSCYAMAENVFAVTTTGTMAARTVSVDAERLATEQWAQSVDPADANARLLVSSGRALPGVEVSIIDGGRRRLEDGRVGQVAIRAPCLFKGYVGGEEQPPEFFSDGHFLTGDLGVILGGELYVVGREKDLIIVAGRNVYPQDIETALDDIPGLIPGRSVAFAVPDLNHGTDAVVVLAETRVPAGEQDRLKREITAKAAQLAGTTPLDIRLVPHMWLVKSTSGKISRAINRDRYLAERAPILRSREATPGGDLPERVRAVVHAVVSQTQRTQILVDDGDRFLEMGLVDSLGYTALLHELENALGRAVPEAVLRDPARYGTIEALIEAYRSGGPSATVPARLRIDTLQERRWALAPQLRDSDRVEMVPTPYVMEVPRPLFASPTANSDERGFRQSIKNGRRITLREFSEWPGAKGIVLGNSQVWGTGATGDERVVHNVLNRERADELWYSFALRRSALTQERIAAELYAPLNVEYAVWISGMILLSLWLLESTRAMHELLLPYPAMGEYYKKMGWPAVPRDGAPTEARWREMLELFEREIAVFSRVFGRGARTLVFGFQPFLPWCAKPLAPQERELVDIFFATPGLVKPALASEAMRPLAQRFVPAAAAICGRHGVRFVDLGSSPQFAASDWLFVDTAHLSDAGHRALAAAVGPLLDPPTPR